MRLTVLGFRAGMPADGQASSGYLVQDTPRPLLLDCGPGIATALSAHLHPRDLGGVVISHFHLDHCYDILPIGKMLLADHLSGSGTAEIAPVPLYVPEGGRAVLDRLAALFPVVTMPTLDKAFELAFDVREYRSGDTFTLGGCRISMHGMRHAVPSCGARIEAPSGSLAFTGDTGVTDQLYDLAHGVDLLVAEATLAETDRGPHGHLSSADAARAAQRAGARQLLLTHFTSTDPDWLRARHADAARHYDGPIELAAAGLQVAVRAG